MLALLPELGLAFSAGYGAGMSKSAGLWSMQGHGLLEAVGLGGVQGHRLFSGGGLLGA